MVSKFKSTFFVKKTFLDINLLNLFDSIPIVDSKIINARNNITANKIILKITFFIFFFYFLFLLQ